jgi:hypothetical protein
MKLKRQILVLWIAFSIFLFLYLESDINHAEKVPGIYSSNSKGLIINKNNFFHDFDTKTKVNIQNRISFNHKVGINSENESKSIYLDYSTYIGGTNNEYDTSYSVLEVAGVVFDSEGNLVITGRTSSNDYPILNAFQEVKGGGRDVIVSKFSPNGSMLFSTFLGGSGDEWGANIVVDNDDNIIIIGTTTSYNFPTFNSYQSNHLGGHYYNTDIFITKLSADGQSLLFSTYFGGSFDDWGYGIAIDVNNEFVITGSTYSSNLPTTNAYQSNFGGGDGVDAYITKFSSDGQSILFSTYLGGTSHDWGHNIAFDINGSIAFTGGTYSSNFPLMNAYQSTLQGDLDIIVVKFNPNGSLLFSTFFGSNNDDRGYGMTCDNNGNIIITGSTKSTSFPTTQNAFQLDYGGNKDIFLSKFDSNGQTLLYSTFIGGDRPDLGMSVKTDVNNSIIITGNTNSGNFPILNAYQEDKGGGYFSIDAFITKFASNGSLLVSTFFGGGSADLGTNIDVNSAGEIALIGYTSSSNFPTLDAFQVEKSGSYDFFLSVFSFNRKVQITELPVSTEPISTSEIITTNVTSTSVKSNITTTFRDESTNATGYVIEIFLIVIIFNIYIRKRRN